MLVIQRTIHCLLLLVCCLPFFCGCGSSSPSQAEMMRNAIRRSKDDDDDVPQSSSAASQSADEQPMLTSKVAIPGDSEPETQSSQSAHANLRAKPVPATDGATAEHSQPAEDVAAAKRPETESERRQFSIDNMNRIGAAILQYLNDKGQFPAPAICDMADQPMLSWRVALLPYLGQEDLYGKFNQEQPWDSPGNQALLAEIPDVYRSPERWDDRTNYLVPHDSNALFPGGRLVLKKNVEDGLAHTVMLLEVDDDAAVPWTKPADYAVSYDSPARDLGSLRKGQFFVAWGDGLVRSISDEIPSNHWKAMFTIDSGERFTASIVSSPATASVATDSAASVATDSTSPPPDDQDRASEDSIDSAPPDASVPRPAAQASSVPSRALSTDDTEADRGIGPTTQLPVPSEDQRRRATRTFSSLYRSEYQAAQTDEDKRKLADEMLSQADALRSDPVGRYVALEVGRKIATEAGAPGLALDAAEKTIAEFQVDDLAVKSEILAGTLRRELSDGENQTVLETAMSTAEQALANNELQLASRLIAAALAAARRTRDQQQVADVVTLKKRIERAEMAYGRILEAIDQLDKSAADPDANLRVGSYFCFVVQRWEDGLPMLARGADTRLANVAELELRPPRTPHEQVAVADLWWELAEQGDQFGREMKQRSAHWYGQALPMLDAGMQRIKAEVRIQQAER